MNNWLTKARTLVALGLPNIARVAGYRFGVRLGTNPVRSLRGIVPIGPFVAMSNLVALPIPAVTYWQSSALMFSHWPLALDAAPPDWLANPLTGRRIKAPDRPWWKIPDFDPSVGDIKLIWELSRMDWVLALAQRVRQGEKGALERLNAWLTDWCEHNPPYLGPNWKCGQEAAIRVMHLASAALLLGQVRNALPGLIDLIALHLQRIAPTVQYAMAQDNNHGTSEATALFVGGSWLRIHGDARGVDWEAKGRYWLENRAEQLIGPQGTFSQYSLNYHRVMLDTFSIAECWRRQLELPTFSPLWQSRAAVATQWLYTLTDPQTGDGPNVGANDGARLLQLADTAYRDYRPCVQLSMVLFKEQRAYVADGPWNHVVHWLGLALPQTAATAPESLQADDGGFMIMRRKGVMALLRYPRFKFRPSQADALHLDLWVDGKAFLRDAGTYSYNTDPSLLEYFGGVAGHNTVQFDGREQMPRLSRFLLGNWLKTKQLMPIETKATSTCAGAAYRDAEGNWHNRHVQLQDCQLHVRDEVSGFEQRAVLRWRLTPGDWLIEQRPDDALYIRCSNPSIGHTILLSADVPIVRCVLVQGWESLHYLDKTPVPVLELEIAQPGTLTTSYHWAS